MDLKLTVGAQGQIMLPEGVQEMLALHEGSELDVHIEGQEMTLKPAKSLRAIQAAIQKYKGSKPGVLHSLGYSSVDDYLKETRGR